MLTDTRGARLAVHLGRLHAEVARAHPAWADRIEGIDIAADGLAT